MRLLELATKVAGSGSNDRTYFVGCVIKRRDGAIVSSANEKVKTPTPSAHAEARALRKSDWGAELYVARITRNGLWAMSRPCSTCQSIIINRGVKKVFYTISPGEYGVWKPKDGRCLKKKYIYDGSNKIGYIAKTSANGTEIYIFINERPTLIDSFEDIDDKAAEELVFSSFYKISA